MCDSYRRLSAATLVLSAVVFAGCDSSQDRVIRNYRERFMLDSEPSNPAAIADAKESVAEDPDVVVLGQIAAGQQEAFSKLEASFVLSELTTDKEGHGHGEGHDASSCPFCKRRTAKAAVASVQFVDESGKVIPIDARQLLNLKPGDVVVVRGRAEIVEGIDLLKLTADGIYIRRTP
jgi:hypothetical protein